MRRLAPALLGGACVLLGAAPAHAAPSDPPPGPGGPGFVQKVACIGAGAKAPAVTGGISAAQRALGWTSLWGLSQGAGVTVAVIDTGVNPVPGFGGRISGGGDLVDPAKGHDGLVDCDGHGTLVAGLVAGAPDLTTGFAGVAPQARVLAIRQNSERYAPRQEAGLDKTAAAGTLQSLARAVRLAVDQGARVINISAAACVPAYLGGQDRDIRPAIQDAVRRDVVVVAAAGNLDGPCAAQNPDTGQPVMQVLPAAVPEALAVAAVSPNETPAAFTVHGPWVDLAAPGTDVISLNPHPEATGEVSTMYTTQGSEQAIQGTSFAAPIVAGVAALIRARYPHLTAEQVMHRLTATAVHPARAQGSDRAVGLGIVDPRQALTAVLPEEGAAGAPTAPPAPVESLPPAPVVVNDSRPRLVALGGAAGLVLVAALAGLVRLMRKAAPA